MEAYKANQFEYFVSVSAKDRELGTSGIRPVEKSLSSFDDLLNELAGVFGFNEIIQEPIEIRESFLRDILKGTDLLLFVDNLETVSDGRVVQFLETLPKPVKAITTSRIDRVRTAAFPIGVGPLRPTEAAKFFDQYAESMGRPVLRNATEAEKRRLVEACSNVPLAVQWLIGHAKSIPAALSLADTLLRFGRKDDELLEFCFRRVHVDLSPGAKIVLGAVTLADSPQPLEALSVASDLDFAEVEAAVDELKDASLIEDVWDERRRDIAVRCLPMTRRFAYNELQRNLGEEYRMRSRLSNWYEGRDVDDEQRRKLVIAARQGRTDPDIALVDAAIMYRRQGLITEAERYFNQAIERNPISWRAHREYAELLRDGNQVGAALEHYQRAAANAPARGEDRARIFREWGMLLRRSGMPRSVEDAIEKFEIARIETPNDPILSHALASAYVKKGSYKKAVPLLEALVETGSAETRLRSYGPLTKCYESLGDRLRLIQLRDRQASDDAAKAARRQSKRTVLNTSKPLSIGRSPKREFSRAARMPARATATIAETYKDDVVDN